MANLTEEQVRNCKVFYDADIDTVNKLIDQARIISYNKNRQIVGQADSSTDVYLVVDGMARAKSFSEKGKEVSYRDICAGELFGEFSAIDEGPRSAAILAVTQCDVAKLPARDFREIVVNDPKVALALIELLIEKNRALTERVHEFGTLAVRFRIQSELLRLAEASCPDDAQTICFDIPTHSELANRICTHREAVTKELNYLSSKGLIRPEKEGLYIDDYPRFKQFAGNLDARL